MATSRLKLKILIAALDWGMGHTTRCIPLISQLKKAGHELTLAGTAEQQMIIKQEFTGIRLMDLPGYEIRLSSCDSTFRLLFQWPAFQQKIKIEKEWLDSRIPENGWDVIISDNRFGLYHPSALSIFITHQLAPRSGMGAIGNRISRAINYRLIEKFDCCWVPDLEERPNLAGALSHPATFPKTPVKYIGPLTRFALQKDSEESEELLVLLSGPEPQRSEFETLIINECTRVRQPATILRGKAVAKDSPQHPLIHFISHLSANELQSRIARAKWVLSRTGYSTVMDLLVMQKQGILIPTPGQTEQEYLGRVLSEKRWAFVVEQKNFDLARSLREAANFPFQKMDILTPPPYFDSLIQSARELHGR